MGGPRTHLNKFDKARQVPSMDWRHHFTAAIELIKLRGGLTNFARSSDLEPLKPLILHLLILGVITNTTTPPSQHIPTTSQLEIIDIMTEFYGDGIYPILLCPPYLFVDIIKINNLRFQSTTSPVSGTTRATAQELLEHIEAFSPEDWTEERRTNANPDTKDDWLLLGRIYRSTVALYCISSLQSLDILPSSRYFTAMRTVHGTRLFTFLRKALVNPRIKNCMIWPVVVAGMQAVDASPNVRHIVDEQLVDLGQCLGTPAPLWASAVFRRFWASGRTGWDDCFEKAHLFVS
ncbi:hypothetical protein BBP40_002723 [Aspergillus hancockii]|nr:hypothetical protein BBP40_002723 [Aspergillus hancockii]